MKLMVFFLSEKYWFLVKFTPNYARYNEKHSYWSDKEIIDFTIMCRLKGGKKKSLL